MPWRRKNWLKEYEASPQTKSKWKRCWRKNYNGKGKSPLLEPGERVCEFITKGGAFAMTVRMSNTFADNDKLISSGFTLPAYVHLRPEGVFINLSPPPAQEVLRLFIDRLFSNEARFTGLDYAIFTNLLYGSDSTPAEESVVNSA